MSAGQTIHMKRQDLFSLNNNKKKKKIRMSSAKILPGTFRVNYSESYLPLESISVLLKAFEGVKA